MYVRYRDHGFSEGIAFGALGICSFEDSWLFSGYSFCVLEEYGISGILAIQWI